MSSNTIVGLSSPINPDDSVNKMILKSFDSDELVIIHKVDNLEKKK